MTNLDLGNNKFTDSGIITILKEICNTGVTRLDISSNRITEKCIVEITGILVRAKSLKTLNMQNNEIASRNAKNRLINSLKNVDVII